MKKILITLLLIFGFAVTQAQYAVTSAPSTDTTSIILSSVVSAYSDGEHVTNSSTGTVTLATPVPTWINTNKTGYAITVTVDIDSVYPSGLSFEVFAMKDTVTLGATLAANHSILQSTDAFADLRIGSVVVTCSSLGSWAAGARRTFGTAQWIYPYKLPAGKTKIFWIIKSTGTWTPKQSAKLRLIITTEAT